MPVRSAGLLATLLLPLSFLPCRAADREEVAGDERLVKEAGVEPSTAGLLAYFRQRTLTDADRKHLETLVRQLGDEAFAVRERASKELVKHGAAAVPPLRRAQRAPDVEVARRATMCLEEIVAGSGDSLPMAAARLLVRRAPPETAAVLLSFLPFADDETVEDEVRESLAVLTAKTGKADPALVVALADALPARRAAAAFALGRVSEPRVRQAVQRLLSDREVKVRLQAAQGLLAGHDKAAVPALIDLLTGTPPEIAGRAEEHLLHLAGDKAPPPRVGIDPVGRIRLNAWKQWWQDEGPRLDLARLEEAPRLLGLNLIPEMHGNKVWECGPDGKPLWELTGLQCPIDAQVLPGNRLLVAELGGNQVSERDRAGKVLWSHAVNTPIYCQRLANGRTFIATNHRVFVVTSEGKEVASYAPENGFFIHSVQRLRSGHVVLVSMEGTVREIDGTFKAVCSVALPMQGGWSGVEGVAGNRYLVVHNTSGKVLEVDRAGKVVWECTTPGACYASRLPNGHTLVVSNRAGLVEVDRSGKTVWNLTVNTGLWRGHRR
jgi:HEAT repeat protein